MDLRSWPCTELQGWKQKLGVLERFRLAGLTAFGLWAAFSKAWGSGVCGQHRVPLVRHSVLGLLHPYHSQLLQRVFLILTQNLASTNCTVQLHTGFIGRFPYQGTKGRSYRHTFRQQSDSTGWGLAVQQPMFKARLSFTYIFNLSSLHCIMCSPCLPSSIMHLLCFNWLNIHTFSAYECYNH